MFNVCLHLLISAAVSTKAAEVLPMNTTLPRFFGYKMPNDSVPRTKTLRLISSVTYTGYSAFGPTVMIAHKVALQKLKSQKNWLPGYDLVFDFYDDQSDDEKIIQNTVTKLRQSDESSNTVPLMGIVELAGQPQIICAYLMRSFNMLTTSAYPLPQLFYNKHKFPNYIAYGESQDYYTEAAVDFIAKMGWRRVAVISDTNPFNTAIDPYLINRIEAELTLVYLSKFIYGESLYDSEGLDVEGLETTFQELAKRQPRIIVQHAWQRVAMACYLPKFGLYGPGYVIITYTWTNFDQTSEIPEILSSWCTKQMLLDVLRSVIYYGDAPLADIYGENSTDSMGTTKDELIEAMRNGVEKPEEATDWEYFSPLYYDRSVLMGLILNKTETLLNKVNMTLSDWTLETKNFKENASYILNLLKEAMYQTEIRGVKGEYSFDRKTKWSSGSMPVIFYQIQINEEKQQSSWIPIGYFKSNNAKGNKTTIDWRVVKWRTHNGLAPKDFTVTVQLDLPLLPPYASSILYAFAGLLTLASLATSIFLAKKRQYLKLLIPSANILMLCSIFLIPFDSKREQIGIACSATVCLIVLAVSAIQVYITLAFQAGVARIQNENAHKFHKIAIIVCFLVAPFILILAAQINAPAKTLKVDAGQKYSTIDESLVYQFNRLECQVLDSLLRSNVQRGMTFAAAALMLLAMLRATMMAVGVKSLASNRMSSNVLKVLAELKLWSVFIYCFWLILIAFAFIGAIVGAANSSLTILISAFVILVSCGSLLVLILGFHIKSDRMSGPTNTKSSSRRA